MKVTPSAMTWVCQRAEQKADQRDVQSAALWGYS
jgi:hypothetical protein